jgi:hypothetical protein
MKAILDNFKHVSDTEFRLKKDMQFARITIGEDEKIQTVDYQDKQNIEVGDILSYNSTDFTITNINADDFNELVVTVEKIDQPEQDVPDKTKFVPRKMTARKPRKPLKTEKEPEVVKLVTSPVIKTENEVPVHRINVVNSEKEGTIEPKPKKQNIFKRFAGWISDKLSTYSNS